MKYLAIIFLWLLTNLPSTNAQNITFVVSENLSVCQTTELKLLIKNNTGAILNTSDLRINMPCDTEYKPGSIIGGTEKSITNLNIPVFQLGNILPDQDIVVKMNVALTCAALPCLDSQQSFVFNANLTSGALSKDFTSPPINTDSPNLVITSINNTYEEIPSFSSKIRKITIRNSRAGRTKDFIYRHNYDPHIDVLHDKGRLIGKTSTYLELRFDSVEFKKIGNRDAWFDFNESIDVNENITVTACSYDHRFVRSDYIVTWGCNNTVCQQNSAIANIRILDNNDFGNKLNITLEGTEPLCYFGGTADQKIKITKAPHKNVLYDMQFRVEQPYFDRGIIVNSLMIDFNADIKYFEVFTNDCGQEVAKYALIFVNRIEPTSGPRLMEIKWKTGFCEPSECGTKVNAWKVSSEYRKECAGNGDSFQSQSLVFKDIRVPVFTGTISISDTNDISLVPNVLKDGFYGFLYFSFNNDHFTANANDSFKVRLEIPKGIKLLNKDFLIGDKTPVKINEILDGRDDIYELVYLLPFNLSTITIKVPFKFNCLEVLPPEICSPYYASCICSEIVVDNINAFGELILEESCPENYHPKVCVAKGYEIECENIKPCYRDTLAGSFGYQATALRTSYGKVDTLNIGIADSIQIDRPDLYQLRYLVAGDSFDIAFNGEIVVDKPGSVFSDLVLRIGHKYFLSNDSLTADFYKTLLIGPGSAISTYQTKVRIKQRASGLVYEFSKLNELFDQGAYFLHLSADSLRWYNPGTNFPIDYKYSVGDSINIILSKKIDIDAFAQNKDNIKLGQFFQFNYVFNSFVGNIVPERDFDSSPCDCDSPLMFFPQFLLKAPTDGSSYEISIIAPPICPDSFLIQNIYDFSFGHIKIVPPPIGQVFPYEVRESILPRSITFSKSKDIAFGNLLISYLGQNFVFEPVEQGNEIIYDFKEMVPPAGSHFEGSEANIFRINLQHRPLICINLLSGEPINFKIKFDLNELGKLYFPDSVVTRIKLSFPKPKISTFVYQKELTAFSNKFNSGFTINGPNNVDVIDNIFIRIVQPSGNLTDIKIRDTITNRIYIAQNGYFQLGRIQRNGFRHFELFGVSKSCGQDLLYIEYGFDCGEYDNPAFPPCFQSIDTIRINFPDGLVDMLIEEGDNPYIQLCDTTTQKVTYFNAGLGNAYDMKIQLKLPQGMKLVPNSAFIYYPARQTITGFAIPDPILNTQQIPEWSLQNIWNQHAVDGLFGAGFFPNNEFDLTYKAVTDCDFTSGLPIIYTINAKKGCGTITNRVTKNSKVLNLEGLAPLAPINISAMLTPSGNCNRDEAEIMASFPAPNATNTQLVVNLPPDWQVVEGSVTGNLLNLIPIQESNLYVWPLSGTENMVNIKFKIKNLGSLLCLSDLITIYVADRASVNCIATGQPCEVGSVAGLATLPLEINQSVFSLTKAKIEKRNGQINLFSELTQSAGTWFGPVAGILFIDNNNNGILDIADRQISSINYSDFNVNNKSISQWINLSNISENDYCKLTIYIPAPLNCICEDIILPLNREIDIFEADIMLCSDESTTIGIATQPSALFQWNQAEGLNCTQCPEATFMVNNSQNSPLFFTKILTTTIGTCQTRHHYNITVNPLPKLLSNPLTICKGDTITAITTSATQYVWQGIDIIQGNQQLLIAVPDMTTTYQVTITDAFGCQGFGNLDVKVINYPDVYVLNDTILCKDTAASLHVEVANANFFSWTQGGNRLDNPASLKPNINILESFVFGLEVRNGSCKREVKIPVNFYNIPEGSASLEICQGESYLFDNQLLNSPGKYCKMQKSVLGCDSTFCLNLSVRPLPEIMNLPDSLYKDKDVDLIINGPSGFESYTWIPAIDLSCVDCPSPLTSTQDTITYLLEVTDDLGCKAFKRTKILINDFCISEGVTIPNAFSPNDDGINDYFTLGNVALCNLHLKVFNRWGNLVYEAQNWNNRWDGRSQNDLPLPQGTYFVQLEFINTGTIRSSMVDLRKK
jgi:gliding motility-associated-like protein